MYDENPRLTQLAIWKTMNIFFIEKLLASNYVPLSEISRKIQKFVNKMQF